MEDERVISDEDGKSALEIFKKALGFRPNMQKAILGTDLSALSEEEQLNERLTPTVAVHHFDLTPEIPYLYPRFVGDMTPVINS